MIILHGKLSDDVIVLEADDFLDGYQRSDSLLSVCAGMSSADGSELNDRSSVAVVGPTIIMARVYRTFPPDISPDKNARNVA